MLKTIRFAALALPALLLAGCAANPLRPAEHTATVETAATPQPQTLNVYATDALLPALQDYATTQEVTLNVTDDPGQPISWRWTINPTAWWKGWT